MATLGKTLFAHFRQVLHASAQYDQAITVLHRLKKRLEVSNLCSLSWDQTVTFSDLAHGLLVNFRVSISCQFFFHFDDPDKSEFTKFRMVDVNFKVILLSAGELKEHHYLCHSNGHIDSLCNQVDLPTHEYFHRKMLKHFWRKAWRLIFFFFFGG